MPYKPLKIYFTESTFKLKLIILHQNIFSFSFVAPENSPKSLINDDQENKNEIANIQVGKNLMGLFLRTKIPSRKINYCDVEKKLFLTLKKFHY